MIERKGQAIGSRVKELRQNKKLTQEQLGRLLSCSKPLIARIEAGTAAIAINKLNDFADVLDTSVAYLVGFADSSDRSDTNNSLMLSAYLAGMSGDTDFLADNIRISEEGSETEQPPEFEKRDCEKEEAEIEKALEYIRYISMCGFLNEEEIKKFAAATMVISRLTTRNTAKEAYSEKNHKLCPMCSFTLSQNQNFCGNCGQAIKWSDS